MRKAQRPSAVIVGAGLMGRWHADAARRAGVSIAGIVDQDVVRARALARRHTNARTGQSLAEFLGDGSVDVVHVCTPGASHEALAYTALEAGCHALVEKPIGADFAAVDRLFAAAARHRRLLCPVHQFLFQRGTMTAARELERLGPLRHLAMDVCSAGAESTPESRDEIAVDILPHVLALASRFCGAPITEGAWECRRPAAGEVLVLATVGVVGVSARISMRGRPPVNRLLLVAEGGTVHVDLFHGFAFVERAGTSRSMKIVKPLRFAARLFAVSAGNLMVRALRAEPAYPGLRELVRRFYGAAAGREATPIPEEETRSVMKVWDELRLQFGRTAEPPPRRRAVEPEATRR